MPKRKTNTVEFPRTSSRLGKKFRIDDALSKEKLKRAIDDAESLKLPPIILRIRKVGGPPATKYQAAGPESRLEAPTTKPRHQVVTDSSRSHQTQAEVSENTEKLTATCLGKPERLAKAVTVKVEQVLAFTKSGLDEESAAVLDRDPTDETCILVPESALLAALMCMRADYQIDRDLLATISDAEPAIVRQYEERIGNSGQPVTHYVLRSDINTDIEKKIKTKICGHGVEHLPLLKIELIMYTVQQELAAANELLRAVDEVEGSIERNGQSRSTSTALTAGVDVVESDSTASEEANPPKTRESQSLDGKEDNMRAQKASKAQKNHKSQRTDISHSRAKKFKGDRVQKSEKARKAHEPANRNKSAATAARTQPPIKLILKKKKAL